MQDIKHSSANTVAKQEVDSELYCAESSGHSLSVTEIQTFANEIQAFADEVQSQLNEAKGKVKKNAK